VEEAGESIGDTQSDQLLVIINLIFVSTSEGFGDGNALQHTNHSHDDKAFSEIL